MKDTSEYELIISQGNRPIWKTILASLFFTLALYLLCIILLPFFFFEVNEGMFKSGAHDLRSMFFFLAAGIHQSIMKTVLIDVDKNKIISRYHIGPFSRDKKSDAPELEYVSVFKDGKDMFQANLWYKGNRHYKMFAFEEKEPAFRFAEMVSDKLAIDLLDATVKGDFKWIDKEKVNL